MCFGSSKTPKTPPPQPPTTFDYSNQSQDTVSRQAATYESLGYTNTAKYGSELSGGASSTPSPAPAAAVPAMGDK